MRVGWGHGQSSIREVKVILGMLKNGVTLAEQLNLVTVNHAIQHIKVILENLLSGVTSSKKLNLLTVQTQSHTSRCFLAG
jgi:hypothetical protein